ncbi:MAG: Bug family tripartite tricarboxylate transporter substrate binding protein [Lautropia sp.]
MRRAGRREGTDRCRRGVLAAGGATLLGALARPARAQGTWPERPIRIVAPFPSGSAADVTARLLGERLTVLLGQPVVVENRVGASGAIGSKLVATAPADGYTLLIGSVTTHGINPAVVPKLSYRAVEDFAPVASVATTPNIFVGAPALGIKTIPEMVKLAKSKPGQLNYAALGPGSGPHFCGELLKALAGIDVVAVHYKGAPDAFTAVIRNDVAYTIQSITSALPMVQSGQIVPLAVTGRQRSPLLPAVPTVAEGGYPDYEFTSWTGILAPAATPSAVVGRLNRAIRDALAEPGLRKRLEDLGGSIETGTPEQFGRFIRDEVAKWSKVAQTAGIKADE